MFKLKQKYIFIFLIVFIIVSISLTNFAAYVPVTEESLNSALQGFVSSGANTENYQISMSDGKINISVDGKSYILNYDLTNNPQFTISFPIQQGMNYNEYEDQLGNVVLPMIGYIGVANIQGVNYEDAYSYFGMCALMNTMSNMNSSKYVIVSDGADFNDKDKIVIYESDFKNHVMEYVNSIFSSKQTFRDAEKVGGFNTFTWTTEQTDVTETSCNIVSTVTINTNADFSKINGYTNYLDPYKEITEQTADYVVKLKVGQKCQIKSKEKILGYESFGADCIEFNENNDIITATKPGTKKGYLFVGSASNKKSIYISVEDNNGNSALEVITLNIDTENSNNISNNNKESQINNNSENNVANISIIPRTGTNVNPILIFAYSVIIMAVVGIVILIITRKRK